MPNTNTEEGLEKRNCYTERRLEALKWSKTHQERDGYTSSKPHLLSFRGLWNGGKNATRSQAAAAEKKQQAPSSTSPHSNFFTSLSITASFFALRHGAHACLQQAGHVNWQCDSGILPLPEEGNNRSWFCDHLLSLSQRFQPLPKDYTTSLCVEL